MTMLKKVRGGGFEWPNCLGLATFAALLSVAIISLFCSVVTARADLISVPFQEGFIGTIGSSNRQATNVLRFSTLGISSSVVQQNSSTNVFESPTGNDISVTLVLNSGIDTLRIPGNISWKMKQGNDLEVFGFTPSGSAAGFQNYTINYGSGSTLTISSTSNYGLVRPPFTIAELGITDGSKQSGSNDPVSVDELNAYLAEVRAARPYGPITVDTQTVSLSGANTVTPILSGDACLVTAVTDQATTSVETISVVVDGKVYSLVPYTVDPSPTLTCQSATGFTVQAVTWSLQTTTGIAAGVFDVAATITSTKPYFNQISDSSGEELTVVGADPLLSLTKTLPNISALSDGAEVGDQLTYTVTAENIGSVAVTIVGVTDILTTTTSGTSSAVASPGVLSAQSCSGGDGSNNATFSAAETCTWTYTYSLSSADLLADTIENLATLEYDVGGTSFFLQSSAVGNQTVGAPSVGNIFTGTATQASILQREITARKLVSSISDTDSDGRSSHGDVVNFTITLFNSGEIDYNSVSLSSDVLTRGVLGGGSALSLTSGPTTTNNVSDTTLSVGETWTYTASYSLTQADIDAGGISNIAVFSATPANSQTAETLRTSEAGNTVLGGAAGSVTAVTVTASALIEGVKTSSLADTDNSSGLSAGDTLTYTVTATNTGNVTLSGVAVQSDTLTQMDTMEPANSLSGFTAGGSTTLAPGESVSFTATYLVAQADIDAGGLSNTATVVGTPPSGSENNVTDDTDDGDDQDGNTSNDATENVVSASALIEGVKTSSLADTDNSSGLSAGDTLTYTVTATNTGNVTLSGVAVQSDTLTQMDTMEPANSLSGFTAGGSTTLAPGESVSFTATYLVAQADIDAGGLSNTATVVGTPPSGSENNVTDDTDDGDDQDGNTSNDATENVVSALQPSAEPDRSFGNKIGVIVSISVLDNDSYGDAVVAAVKLFGPTNADGKLLVDGEGVWSVGDGNIVQFTPAQGFVGDPTPIEYVITSSNAADSNKAIVYVDYLGVGAPDDLVAADDELVGQSSDGPVTVSPLENDNSNVESELVQSTLRLIDADNNQVKELTVENEGTWKVNESEGTVTFTPVQGFTGSSVNVKYYVENASGIPQTATIKILFIDPGGVVYDSSTLEPIAGVELKFADANGNALPASCLRDGQQPQTTGDDGRYQFDLSIECTSAAGEEFQILVTSNEGYSLPRTADGLETASLNPGTPSSQIYEVVNYDRAPVVGEARKFYTSFIIGKNSKKIVNNHIPLTRILKLIEDDLRDVLRDDLIATMTQQSRQMAGYAEGALQRLKDNTDNSCSAAIADQLEHNPVMFETALARIIPESAGTLDAVANLLAKCSNTAFDVEGHTDSRGDDADNVVLSNARATAVVNALRQRGIPVEQLSAVGYGESRPIADNATPEGQALNRRVVFTVFDHDLSNASCNENSILERSMDVKADQDGATVDGKYSKESRNCTANSWTTWEGAATFLKTDTGMSQGMLNITRRQEWLLDNDRLRGYFLGAYASNNDITGLATGSIKGFGLTAGGYGAQRISGGSYIDYYLGASTGRHNFDLDFDRVGGAINADGHYDYLATFAGLSLSGETKVGDYKIVPRAGFEAAWSPGGQADYVASREAISDASSLDTGSVSGGRFYGEVRLDDLAPNEPYQLAFKPKLFCDQPLGGGDGICGMGASIELSSTAIDGKGLFTFEIEAEQTRDSRFWGLSLDYSLPVWAGELNIINTLSNQGKLALGLNYERAF